MVLPSFGAWKRDIFVGSRLGVSLFSLFQQKQFVAVEYPEVVFMCMTSFKWSRLHECKILGRPGWVVATKWLVFEKLSILHWVAYVRIEDRQWRTMSLSGDSLCLILVWGHGFQHSSLYEGSHFFTVLVVSLMHVLQRPGITKCGGLTAIAFHH